MNWNTRIGYFFSRQVRLSPRFIVIMFIIITSLSMPAAGQRPLLLTSNYPGPARLYNSNKILKSGFPNIPQTRRYVMYSSILLVVVHSFVFMFHWSVTVQTPFNEDKVLPNHGQNNSQRRLFLCVRGRFPFVSRIATLKIKRVLLNIAVKMAKKLASLGWNIRRYKNN